MVLDIEILLRHNAPHPYPNGFENKVENSVTNETLNTISSNGLESNDVRETWILRSINLNSCTRDTEISRDDMLIPHISYNH